MKFCARCQSRLRRIEGVMICPQCKYSEDDAVRAHTAESAEEVSEFNVLSEDEGREMLPTIKIDCPRCENNEAVWWMLQTRSADEPTTQFYRCSKCSHTWRDYS